jgi:hypothetical protein
MRNKKGFIFQKMGSNSLQTPQQKLKSLALFCKSPAETITFSLRSDPSTKTPVSTSSPVCLATLLVRSPII